MTEKQRRARGSRMTQKHHPELPEKQKMLTKTNLIHLPSLHLLCRLLLDERGGKQLLGRSLAKSLKRATVKSRWCSEISSLLC